MSDSPSPGRGVGESFPVDTGMELSAASLHDMVNAFSGFFVGAGAAVELSERDEFASNDYGAESIDLLTCGLDGIIRAHFAKRVNGAADPVAEIRAARERMLAIEYDDGSGVASEHPLDGWLIREQRKGDLVFSPAGVGESVDSRVCLLTAAVAALWSHDTHKIRDLAIEVASIFTGNRDEQVCAAVFAIFVHKTCLTVNPFRALDAALEAIREVSGVGRVLTVLDELSEEFIRHRGVAPESVISDLADSRSVLSDTALILWLRKPKNFNKALRSFGDIGIGGNGLPALCGGLVGAFSCAAELPLDDLKEFPRIRLLGRLATDATKEFGPEPPNTEEWAERYPLSARQGDSSASSRSDVTSSGDSSGSDESPAEGSDSAGQSGSMTVLEESIELYASEQGDIVRVYEQFLAAELWLVSSEESPDPVVFKIEGQEKDQIWVCTKAEAVPDFAPGTTRVVGYNILPLLANRNVHIATSSDVHDLMLIGERALRISAPEITDEVRRQAAGLSEAWLPIPDRMFGEEDREKLPEHAFVGECWVDENGRLTGDYRLNSHYRPSPVTLGYPEPASKLESFLHLHKTGHLSGPAFVSLLIDSMMWLATDEEGAVLVLSRGDTKLVFGASSEKYVPEFAESSRTATVESIRSFLREGDLLLDPGARHQTTVRGSVLLTELERRTEGEPQQSASQARSQSQPVPQSQGVSESLSISESGPQLQPQSPPQPAPEFQPQNESSPASRTQPDPPPQPQPPDAHERFLGSMLAGATGDALGFGVEFQPIDMIRRTYGEQGLTAPVLQDGLARVSDDTQMMLFTLEGLIRAHVARRFRPSDNDPVPEVQHAYLRWLHTQNRSWEQAAGPYAPHLAQPDGWLINSPALFSVRAPGNTCLTALLEFTRTHRHGSAWYRVNNSKGCGGVMRAAPVAVWSNDAAEVFHAAVGTAALTHGHPGGFLPAGVLATVVHQLLRDVPLGDAVNLARELLLRWPEHEETLRSLDAAIALARGGPTTPEEIEAALGQGWVGEEALAIGVYAAMATDNLHEAMLLSVNHSGDSDSTGILCGNLVGAVHGLRAVPPAWLETLELRDVIHRIAQDALAEFSPGPPNDPEWTQRYPAW